MRIRKENRLMLAAALLLSFLFMGLCSKSSPLYPMNDWMDANCFFTVGKSMIHGLVPYRDLNEQKGPVLYAIYALAALISEHSFVGAYILDAISFGFFLFFSGLCVRLYLGKSGVVYPILILLAGLLCSVEASAHGGSAEQLFLSVLLGSLYLIDRALCENRLLKLWEAFVIGICAGLCLYTKFTFLGFYFGLALFVLVWYCRFEKQPRALPGIIGCFLGGIVAVSVPVFLYFLIHGAVGDFLQVYFYNNLFLYPNQERNKLYFYAACLYTSIRRNFRTGVLLIAAGIWLVVTVKKNYRLLTVFGLSALFLTVAVFWGGLYNIYYPMIFMVYCVYGLIGIVLLGKAVCRKSSLRLPRGTGAAANLLLIVLLLAYAYKTSSNTYLLGTPKEDMPQYRFAQQIRKREDPTLLNFGFLDGGFYFAADVLPVNYNFCRLNLVTEEAEQEQRQIIEDAAVDFVVLWDKRLEECPLDASRYALVDNAEMYYEGVVYTYYLYERVD